LPTRHLLDGRIVALGTHSSLDSPPPHTDDKECQVSISTAGGSTQTSVTTKTVTCQTYAGDDEEQHQPVSLEELISQTSATGDAMRHETDPPQLSDDLLAEKESVSSPLLMHPDFIYEFEILDAWSPPQVPRSPYQS
ncbi:hypothetical protein XENOCAPTIV_000841, partial [Xenoophorus captivus]